MPVSLHDLRHATRNLTRAPALSIAAILCLTLGIGASAAVFSAVNTALLRPLPFPEPHRLVTVFRTTPHFVSGPFSAPNYLDLAGDARTVEGLAALTGAVVLLDLSDETVRADAHRVTGNFFELIGGTPVVGRLLQPADDTVDQPPVVALGEEFWRERFGGDPAIVGRTVPLDGVAHEVVGIVPAGFRVPHGGRVVRSSLWVPMRFSEGERSRRRSNYLLVMGRLAPGATVAAADAELTGRMNGLVEVHPELRGEQIRVVPLHAEGVRAVRTPLLLLMGAVGFVLLIAAANVASLLLARGIQRRREMAIRHALGGGRWALMRPVLAESLLLSAVGAALGVGAAWAGVQTIRSLATANVPQLAGLRVDPWVVGFALALAAVVALVCGAVPAWRAAGSDPQDALGDGRSGGAGRGQHRLLGALVTAEVGLSLVLLLGAGLVLRGFWNLTSRDPGFDPNPMLTLSVRLAPERYPDATSVERFLDPALDAVAAVPGVAAAGAISLIPYEDWGWNFNIRYEGRAEEDPTRRPLVERRVVSPGFFQVSSQRLLAGRMLEHADAEGSPPVVVVNEALARRDFPDEDPIGRRFHIGDTTFATIVGVVSDIRNFGPIEDPRPEVYWSYGQTDRWSISFPIVVRAASDPTGVARPVVTAIRSVDPGAAVTDVLPMTDLIARSVGSERFYMVLLGAFAGVAVLLAMAGLFGVMSYAVAQRTREIGVRTALGATAGRTVGLVFKQGMVLVAVGTAFGLGGAYWLTRFLQNLLYGVSPVDGLTWGAMPLAITLAGAGAILLAARRAVRVDPLEAIRAE